MGRAALGAGKRHGERHRVREKEGRRSADRTEVA
jgi:hypothetical protein